MAFAEVYNALQLGVVDGQENPVNVPVSAKLYEVQKYLTLSNHIADAWVFGVNPARYESLSEEHKAVLAEAAAETEGWKPRTTRPTSRSRSRSSRRTASS